MTLIRVEVNYNPRLTPAELTLLALPQRMKNLRPFMQQTVAPLFNRMEQQHFDTKGAAFGHPWAPWAASTKLARLRKGNAGKGLLRDTDALYNAIFRDRASDDRLKVVGGRLRFQANVKVPYAIYHQVGTQFMPDRQVIPDPLPPMFLRQLRTQLKRFLLTGAASA